MFLLLNLAGLGRGQEGTKLSVLHGKIIYLPREKIAKICGFDLQNVKNVPNYIFQRKLYKGSPSQRVSEIWFKEYLSVKESLPCKASQIKFAGLFTV
jgi:hypothetical protein